MFEKIKDYLIEREVRSICERYYLKLGLTLEEAKRMPMRELVEKLNDFLSEAKNEVTYYASVVKHLQETNTELVLKNQELKQLLTNYKAENKGLNVELVKLREDNYKLKLENTLYKTMGMEKATSLDNTIVKSKDTAISR